MLLQDMNQVGIQGCLQPGSLAFGFWSARYQAAQLGGASSLSNQVVILALVELRQLIIVGQWVQPPIAKDGVRSRGMLVCIHLTTPWLTGVAQNQ